MDVQYIIDLANYSDGVLYALAFLQLMALAVIIDRAWYLRRTIMGGGRLVAKVASHRLLTGNDIGTLRQRAGSLPEATLFDVILDAGSSLEKDDLDDRMEEAILLATPRLDKRLWMLDTIITLAPLLGLFGTILGMFRAFSVLATPGQPPTAVTGGVANALVTTAAGIFVAMVGLLAYNGLSNATRLVVHQMETMRTLLLNRLVNGHRAPSHTATLVAE
ncbi:MAG: flagellar motor protein MotA [Rhodospirillales bacterium 20-64-7]|nr:MAG: flagellar motor protein MotA [Rhodospirillales bacterium 20-64-7]